MNFVYQKIKEIERRPGLYIATPSLLLVKTFLDGYLLREYERERVHTDALFFLNGFQKYVQKYYACEETCENWCQIICSHSVDGDGDLKTFFSLIDAYAKSIGLID